MTRRPVGLKTYSHLIGARRMPTEYEVVTSGLRYGDGALEVDLPSSAWYRAHQSRSALVCDRWGDYRDPREVTYTRYVAMRADAAGHLDGILGMIEEAGLDRGLDPAWVDTLDRVLGPARFLWHAFQMLAAYVGQLAPEGRIAVTHVLQAADETRRIHAIAQRLALLRRARPGFAADGRAHWEREPGWQPLRAVIERALVTWDFGEALVALDVCLKPVADVLLLEVLAEVAERHGDSSLAALLFSLGPDARWQREATAALINLALAASPGNRQVITGWLRTWLPAALEGATALGRLLDLQGPSPGPRLQAWIADWLATLGLEPP